MLEGFLSITLIAVMIGVVASMLGLGGGFLMVPTLSLLLAQPMHTAVGTSLFATFFTSTSASLVYYRQGRIDYKLGLLLEAGTVPGAILGAYSTQFIHGSLLQGIFGFILALVSLRMILLGIRRRSLGKPSELWRFEGRWAWRREVIDAENNRFSYIIHIPLAIAASFAIGFLAGMLGFSGGILKVPLLNLVFRVPIHLAVGTSSFMIILTSISAVIEHQSLGNINYVIGAVLALGIALGAQGGARIAKKVPGSALKILFGLALFSIALKMIYEALPLL